MVSQLAEHLVVTQPGLQGFTRRNLFRMRQFYEAHEDNEIVSTLMSQLPWTHHLIILSQSKRREEREFYLRLAIQEQWSKRELERQFKAALFERMVLNPVKVSPLVSQTHPEALSVFKDTYLVEFLDLPTGHGEADLHRGLLRRLKHFIVELGRDFCFVGSEFPLQVGGRDFALGDGSDLAVHQTELGRLGALCCWENKLSLNKYAMYSQHEQVHVACWPSFSAYEPYAHALGRGAADVVPGLQQYRASRKAGCDTPVPPQSPGEPCYRCSSPPGCRHTQRPGSEALQSHWQPRQPHRPRNPHQ
ncbi:PDDEXK nuclease domain-containing protein [Cupriavidus sp. CV2]|uniref:PDDEXK nuclease domain-containing protein n=1 Tax=Cupriavidus ulmosensis TaxID=3065913 RepID=UPI00296B57BA|nr:PDDEXK nuclease domain-containing protein [Cupriavidus sp. CV2]MDW3682395.1 PDDEXK nuclease domain-containing protein [Cupriavidus sp. CV2]